MKLRILLGTSLLLLATAAFSQQEVSDPDSSGEERRRHVLSEIPAEVLSSARENAPGVVFSVAQSYWEDDERVYRVSGRLYREVWHVYVTEQGRFLYYEMDLQDE